MIKKLRIKFVVVNMGIVTIMLCVILGLVLYFTRANLEAENIRMMQSIASQPFQLSPPDEPGDDVRLPFFTLRLGPKHELISAGGGYYDLSDGPFLDSLIEEVFASPGALGVIDRYNLRYYRVDNAAEPFLVFSDISSERATIDALVNSCFLIGGLSFVIFLWVSIVLSKWAVRPVERAWREQRQFVAAASHELKTPLTVIMTDAELMRSPACSGEKREQFLAGILTMSRQMRALIEQMLELARADSAEAEPVFDKVELSSLLSDVVLQFEPVFFERGRHLSQQIDGGIAVTGCAAQLKELAEILLDNAQKYSRAGGCIWVELRRRGRGRCLLSVSDEGEEIPPGELANIFKRFYRGDSARSRTGSFGLGLSIAESIAARHKGKIWAESKNGVNRFFVELPCL